jgi:aminopeptidase N
LIVVAACSRSGSPAPGTRETTVPSTPTSVPATSLVLPAMGAAGIGDRLYPTLGNGGYDVAAYRIDLAVDPLRGSVEGTMAASAVALEDLSGFHLDLSGLQVSAVTIRPEGGEPARARFEQEGRELVIEAPEPLPKGSAFEVEVTYAGVPEPVAAGAVPFAPGWRRAADSFYVFGEPDGAQSWFPANDHPADKATVELTVHLPAGWQAVSGGRPESSGPGVFRWVLDRPLAPYMVPLAIGTFEQRTEEVGGLTYTTWFDPDLAGGLLDAFRLQPPVIAFFEARFGPYPFDSVGALVVEDDLPAALETLTLPTYTTRSVVWGDVVIAHELAHQWFGNSVSLTQWDDIWLNEGPATFAHWLWQESRQGREVYDGQIDAAYRRLSGGDLVAAGVPAGEARRRAAAAFPPPDDPPPDDLFSASVYERGALALVALRDLVGDEVTFDVLRTWTTRFAHSNATTDDFLAVVAERAGRPAAELVEAWVRDVELPEMPGRGLAPPGGPA